MNGVTYTPIARYTYNIWINIIMLNAYGYEYYSVGFHSTKLKIWCI